MGSREKGRFHVVPECSVIDMFVCGVHIDRLLKRSHHDHADPIRKVWSEHLYQIVLGECQDAWLVKYAILLIVDHHLPYPLNG